MAGEGDIHGLNTDQIARKVFSAAKFSESNCEVDGQSYIGVTDEKVRGQLIRLFGPRLSTIQLERNVNVLEQSKWGWLEGSDSLTINLKREVAHQRVSDLCLLALSSLSPTIVSSVTAILSTLADSLQKEQASLTRSQAEVNVYIRTRDIQLILVNSRLAVTQRSHKLLLCLCGQSSMGMYLSLEIRRLAFTTEFERMIRSDSPRIKIKDGIHLLPPSPELIHRSMTAPTCTPPRPAKGLSSRARQAQVELVALSTTNKTRTSPLSVIRQYRPHHEQQQHTEEQAVEEDSGVRVGDRVVRWVEDV